MTAGPEWWPFAYLLSSEHRVGSAKARFFAQLGFERQDWVLQEAIMRFAAKDARLVPKTPFGQKYVVTGAIEGPNGQTGAVTVVWIILAEEDFPRVTAYPGAK